MIVIHKWLIINKIVSSFNAITVSEMLKGRDIVCVKESTIQDSDKNAFAFKSASMKKGAVDHGYRPVKWRSISLLKRKIKLVSAGAFCGRIFNNFDISHIGKAEKNTGINRLICFKQTCIHPF